LKTHGFNQHDHALFYVSKSFIHSLNISTSKHSGVGSKAVESEHEPQSGAQAILDGWNRSQKLLEGGSGVWNLSSGSTDSLWGKQVVQTIHWLVVFNGPNRSGSAVTNFCNLGVGAGAQNLDAWSWNRNLKFQFRPNRPGPRILCMF